MIQILIAVRHIFLHGIPKELNVHGLLMQHQVADRTIPVIYGHSISPGGLYLGDSYGIKVSFYLIDADSPLLQMGGVVTILDRNVDAGRFPFHKPMKIQSRLVRKNDSRICC